MTTTITAQDGTGASTNPVEIAEWAPCAESGNIVHELLAPGTIAVTVVGDLPRSGELTLVYTSDDTAEAARQLLGRPTSFVLTDTERPVVGMTFVRRGRITPAIHDALDDVWMIEVGFQEIAP